MGDDHPCKVKEIGIVRIKMFDGMVRKLKKVRYVSQVKKNLISYLCWYLGSIGS